MIFYIIIFISLFLTSFLEVISNNKKYSIIIFSLFLFIFFILSFIRWKTGTDWESYYEMYTWIDKPWNNFNNGMESGYNFVNHLGKFLFNSYTGVLFLFSTIIYTYTGRTYITLSKYPITSLFLSFCILSFAHIMYVRQNVAVAITGWSVYYIITQKKWNFIACVLIASLFHRTSLIFLLAYPVFHKNYSAKYYCLSIIGALAIGTLVGKLFLNIIGGLGLGIISSKINGYLELGSEDNSMAISTTTVLVKGFINRSFVLFLIFYCKYKLKHNSLFFNGLTNLYILGTILYFITLPLSISLARIAVYMDSLQVILIPYIIYHQRTLYNRILFFIFISSYFYLRFYSYIISFKTAYIPFITIFQHN